MGMSFQERLRPISESAVHEDPVSHGSAGEGSFKEEPLARSQSRDLSDSSIYEEHESFLTHLLSSCLRNLRELWRVLSATGTSEERSANLQEQLDRLFLWRQGFPLEDYQRAETLFKEETDLMLECLTDIGRWIVESKPEFYLVDTIRNSASCTLILEKR